MSDESRFKSSSPLMMISELEKMILHEKRKEGLMKKTYEVVDLYREIGKEFRRLGAEKVILLHAKTNPQNVEEMYLEVAVEGFVEKEKLLAKSREEWPFLSMEIMVLDEVMDKELVLEIMEDGIII